MDQQQKEKIWFVHGRPGPHPLHKKYGESVNGELLFVDPVLRWHDKKVPAFLRYFYWMLNAIWIAGKVKRQDVILTEGVHVTVLLAKKIAAFFGKKIFAIALMDDEFLYFLSSGFYKGASAKYNRYFVKQYDHFFCIGEMEYQLCLDLIKDNRKISKGFNGVAAQRMEELLAITPDVKSENIIFIGNGPSGWRAYYKGLDIILQVFSEVIKKYKKSKLFIVGDWESSFLESCISKYCLNAKENVIAVGRTNELSKYLSKSSLYLHPGRGEAWGISINEAMCAGVVPIVSEWTGASECVRKVNDELVTPLDIDFIVNRINQYWQLDIPRREQLSIKAKEVSTFYTETAAISRFKEMFFEWYRQ